MHEISAKHARNGSAERMNDERKLQSLDMLLPKRSWESRCDLDDLGILEGSFGGVGWWWSNVNSLQIQKNGIRVETRNRYIYILPCNLNMKTKLHHNLHPGNFTWISKMMFFLVYLLSIVAILGINSLMFRVTNWDGGVKPESYRNSMGCS